MSCHLPDLSGSGLCLLQLKAGEIHTSTEVAAELAAPSGPMEVQHFGYALLQHLVRPVSSKSAHEVRLLHQHA